MVPLSLARCEFSGHSLERECLTSENTGCVGYCIGIYTVGICNRYMSFVTYLGVLKLLKDSDKNSSVLI